MGRADDPAYMVGPCADSNASAGAASTLAPAPTTDTPALAMADAAGLIALTPALTCGAYPWAVPAADGGSTTTRSLVLTAGAWAPRRRVLYRWLLRPPRRPWVHSLVQPPLGCPRLNRHALSRLTTGA